MESISLAVSSNLVKRALSLMLRRIHFSISVLVAFVGALSSWRGSAGAAGGGVDFSGSGVDALK